MLRLGYCPDCSASFESPTVTTHLCPACQATQDRQYANDPTPMHDEPPRPYSREWLRERLGVSGDVDE